MKSNNLIKFSLALVPRRTLSPARRWPTDGIGDDWRAQYPDACQELQDCRHQCHRLHPVPYRRIRLESPTVRISKTPTAIFPPSRTVDSDGDGRTNGEEILLDCTLPGRRRFRPRTPDTWGSIKVLFR